VTVLRDLVASYARSAAKGQFPATISVVGNAPLAPDPARAAEIDRADLVVRMTSFALDEPGAPAALGSRCDVAVIHRGVIASPFTFADHTSRLYLLAEPGRLHWEPEELPLWWPASLGFVPISNYDFTLPLITLLGLPPTEAAWPTTGTLVIYLLTELFPDAALRVAGMTIVDRPDQAVFQHAWGQSVAVTAEHRLQAESELLRRWGSEGRVEWL
jgi:hypothetical protein